MSSLVNKITLSEEQKAAYERDGAVKIEGFLSKDMLDNIQELLDEASKREAPELATFSKAMYDVGNQHPITQKIYESDEFKYLINQLFSNRFYFTQGLYFELEKNKQPGFKWHFGRLSFNYILPYDFGFTLWIPLDKVDRKKQGGGLAYISESDYSAKEDYKKASFLYEYTKRGLVDREFAESIRPGALPELFDAAAIEPDFNPGDVLLFNKFVWHRSVPLREGDLEKRRAFVMRFISNNAKYNKDFMDLTDYIGLNEFSTYGRIYSDLSHGELISESEYAGKPL